MFAICNAFQSSLLGMVSYAFSTKSMKTNPMVFYVFSIFYQNLPQSKNMVYVFKSFK